MAEGAIFAIVVRGGFTSMALDTVVEASMVESVIRPVCISMADGADVAIMICWGLTGVALLALCEA